MMLVGEEEWSVRAGHELSMHAGMREVDESLGVVMRIDALYDAC